MNKHLFGDTHPDNVMRRVNRAWSFRHGFVPIPKFQLACPICKSREIHYSRCSFWEKEESALERVDVGFKCTWCSHFWIHGVPVPGHVYETAISESPTGNGKFHWTDIERYLNR